MTYISVPPTALEEAKVIMPGIDIRGDLIERVNDILGKKSNIELKQAGIINFVFNDQ